MSEKLKLKSINTVKWNWIQNEFSFLEEPRTCYGFLSVTKGRVDYILENKTISLAQGDFIYLPKNSIYKAKFYINEGPVETLLVNFDLEDDNIFEMSIPPFYTSQDKTLQFETALKRLCDLEDEENTIYLKQAYFYLCFHIIYTSYLSNRNPLETELVVAAKKLLKESDYSLSEIAERLNISPSGLRQKFKDAVGISPAKWRIEKKIEQAKNMLLTSDLSIDEIALKTGFYDTPYFHKKFYALVGMTPKRYRETNVMY